MRTENKKGGLLVKHLNGNSMDFVRWQDASLREASHDRDGYYLKVDGTPCEKHSTEQLYLYLTERDVPEVIKGWAVEIQKNGSEMAKFLLTNVLTEIQKQSLCVDLTKEGNK